MDIKQRMTIEHDGLTDYRIYLESGDGRMVTLDTKEMLKDAEAIARAEEILASAGDAEGAEMIALGDTLAETMASVISAHESWGDAVEYSDCVEAIEAVKPKPLPIKEVVA